MYNICINYSRGSTNLCIHKHGNFPQTMNIFVHEFKRIHSMQNSQYAKFTVCRINSMQNSQYTEFTVCKIHSIQNSQYAKFTVCRIHSIQNSQ